MLSPLSLSISPTETAMQLTPFCEEKRYSLTEQLKKCQTLEGWSFACLTVANYQSVIGESHIASLVALALSGIGHCLYDSICIDSLSIFCWPLTSCPCIQLHGLYMTYTLLKHHRKQQEFMGSFFDQQLNLSLQYAGVPYSHASANSDFGYSKL